MLEFLQRRKKGILTMTIKEIKEEVKYYLRRHATDEEAEEILGFVEDNPGVSLDEIVAEYYGCSL